MMKSLNKFRNLLYKLARVLGDINAFKKGKISQRIGRRAIGRFNNVIGSK